MYTAPCPVHIVRVFAYFCCSIIASSGGVEGVRLVSDEEEKLLVILVGSSCNRCVVSWPYPSGVGDGEYPTSYRKRVYDVTRTGTLFITSQLCKRCMVSDEYEKYKTKSANCSRWHVPNFSVSPCPRASLCRGRAVVVGRTV